jgi:hypothetical protein
VGTPKYLGLVIKAKGGCEEDVRHCIKAAWQKWKDLFSVVCDRNRSAKVKGKVYQTIVQPVMPYGAEAWTMWRNEERLERAEMRMLRWMIMLGVTLRDRRRNEDIL